MRDLLHHLSHLRRPVGTVVVIGGGPDAASCLDTLIAHPPKRLLFVEGDTENAAGIDDAISRGMPAQLQPVVVMPQRGAVAWHRYSLAALNGPVDMLALRSHYPRLKVIEQRQVSAVALVDVLEPLALDHDDGTAHALVFDVPGQEAALLQGLPPRLLEAFELMVLRGCALPLAGSDSSTATALLQSVGFECVQIDADSEPLWPMTVMRFDIVRHRLARLREQVDTLNAELGQRDDALAALRAAFGQSESLVAEKRSKLKSRDNLLAEANHRMAILSKERDEALARAQVADEAQRSTERRYEQARAAHDSDSRLLAERNAQVDALWRDKRELEDALHAQQASAEELQTRLRSAQSELSALHVQLAQERSRLQEVERQVNDARNASARDLTDGRHQIEQMRTRLQSGATEQTQLGRRQQLLQEELYKAEGQLDLIRSLLLSDTGL